MWDMLILNSSTQNSNRRKNYLDLVAIERANEESAKVHHTRKAGSLFSRMAQKIHF